MTSLNGPIIRVILVFFLPVIVSTFGAPSNYLDRMAAKLTARSVSVNTGFVRGEVRVDCKRRLNRSVVHNFLLNLFDIVGDGVGLVSVHFVVSVRLSGVVWDALVRALGGSATFSAWRSIAWDVVLTCFQTL